METNASFYCPITAELMVDPVIDREGNSYERDAIEAWIRLHHTSPITRNALELSDLAPNRALRDAIADYQSKGIPLPRHIDSSGVINDNDEHAEEPPVISLTLTTQVARSAIGSRTSEGVEVFVNASVFCQERRERIPSDIVLVVDVSGSMGNSATAHGVEDSGLSMLDIVKHAVRTIIKTLNGLDRLAVVSFSDFARVIFSLTPMTDAGKRTAEMMLDTLQPSGMTNLWDGLNTSLNLLRDRDSADGSAAVKNGAVLLLTDGEPNIIPPRGNLPMLQRYFETNGGKYPGIISTFGFGYNLDSELLAAIAAMGGGMYAFIPDSGFVGTAFVNALSNTLVTTAVDSVLTLQPREDGVRFLPDEQLGETDHSLLPTGEVVIPLGSIQCGQSKDLVKRVFVPHDHAHEIIVRASLQYRPNNQSPQARSSLVYCEAQTALAGQGMDSGLELDKADLSLSQLEVDSQLFRVEFVGALAQVLAIATNNANPLTLERAQAPVAKIINEIKTWLQLHGAVAGASVGTGKTVNQPYRRVKDLLADLEGQVAEAISRVDWYYRWGCHYLRSLRRAHELQQCNNFKDPGIQHYGGGLFRTVRDFADDAFCNLPPPKSRPAAPQNNVVLSRVMTQPNVPATRLARPPAPVSMAAFNSRDTPCFHERSRVEMEDGRMRAVGRLRAGDRLAGGRVLRCLVQTRCRDGRALMARLPGLSPSRPLLVTPWHPVLLDQASSWAFPALCPNVSLAEVNCQYVYSLLVYESNESEKCAAEVRVEGVRCLALGHGLSQDEVAAHDFFGTHKVVDALRRCTGWRDGLVRLSEAQGCVVRGADGRVCGFREEALPRVPVAAPIHVSLVFS